LRFFSQELTFIFKEDKHKNKNKKICKKSESLSSVGLNLGRLLIKKCSLNGPNIGMKYFFVALVSDVKKSENSDVHDAKSRTTAPKVVKSKV